MVKKVAKKPKQAAPSEPSVDAPVESDVQEGDLHGDASFAGVLDHSENGSVNEDDYSGHESSPPREHAPSNKRKRAKKQEVAEKEEGPALNENNVMTGYELELAMTNLKTKSDALHTVVLQAQREDAVGEKNRALLLQYWYTNVTRIS